MWLKQRQAYVCKGLNNLLWNLCKNHGEIAQCNYFITILWKFSYMVLNFVFLNSSGDYYYWKQFSLICHFYSHVMLLDFQNWVVPINSAFSFLKNQIGTLSNRNYSQLFSVLQNKYFSYIHLYSKWCFYFLKNLRIAWTVYLYHYISNAFLKINCALICIPNSNAHSVFAHSIAIVCKTVLKCIKCSVMSVQHYEDEQTNCR